jgi:hypothetical protein
VNAAEAEVKKREAGQVEGFGLVMKKWARRRPHMWRDDELNDDMIMK